MSTYIKSIDPFHLVTTGSEGEFNDPKSDDWAYNGSVGADFDGTLALANVDYGVFHTYPDWWSKSIEWSNQWIRDHAASGKKAGKPVVHEEYGWLSAADRLAYLNKVAPSNETRLAVEGGWQQIYLSEQMCDMYWQFGYSGYSYGRNDDDGFTIYLEDADAKQLVYQHAKDVAKLNI